MVVDCIAYLDTQRKAHPELSEKIDLLQKYAEQKLYHQLTQTLLDYIVTAPFSAADSASASKLLDFFNNFIKPFETKFDKVRWVQILAIIAKPQSAQKALDELIVPFEASVSAKRDSKYFWQALKAEKLVPVGKAEEAKELLETLGKEIEDAYEVDALIQSEYHKTNAFLWKSLSRPQDFYKSSILYLAFTPLSAIPASDQPRLGFEIVTAALIAPEEFNFGELLQQDLLKSLVGSEFEWVKEVLEAFGEGKFDMYDTAITKHSAKIKATPELANSERILRQKMSALSLMELAFRKPKKQRRLTFNELAQHCRVDAKEVEHLVMKAMCAQLIKGKIDEVEKMVLVTWVKPRILDTARIDMMRKRMDEWGAQTGLLLEHLEELTPELLVS